MEPVFDKIRSLKEDEDQRKELRVKLSGVTPTMLAHRGNHSAIAFLESLDVPKTMAIVIAVTSLYYESRKHFRL